MFYSKSIGFCLLAGASLVVLALPVFAQDPAGNIPPRPPETAGIPMPPPEILIEPQATGEIAPDATANNEACVKRDGFIEDTGQSLPAVYMTGVLREFDQSAQAHLDYNDRDPWTAGIENGGTLSLGGIFYPLSAIQVDPSANFPLSSVRYDMSFNFMHKSQDGETIIVSVPVKQGAMNIGASQIIGSIDASFNPNTLLPDNRSMALIEETGGENCPVWQKVRRYMLLTPIEISPGQLEKLGTQC